MSPLYTVQKITKSDKLYGPIHGSEDGSQTLCGKSIDENWYILNNNHDGEMTCLECERAYEKRISRKIKK